MLRLHRFIVNVHKKSQNGRYITTTSCYKWAKENSEEKRNQYTTVFKFPFIRVLSIINRLKYYHSGLTVVSIPATILMNKIEIIDFEGLMFTTMIGVSGCVTLFSLGYIAQKFIGFIYYNEEKETVKIAFLDFWGHRKEIEVPRKDIVPLHEANPKFTDKFYLKFARFSSNDTFKINLKYGLVVDQKAFDKIFSRF